MLGEAALSWCVFSTRPDPDKGAYPCISAMNTSETLSAVQHIRRMRGGSQAHLMRASDGCFHVVKFQNNPQNVRVLANEYFGSRIGLWLGLPMPEVAAIEVADWLISHTPDLHITIEGRETPCRSGLQLASRFVADPEHGVVFDYLPENFALKRTSNLQDLARALVFDKWAGNADGRQAVFTKSANAPKYNLMLIDQGYCFNCGVWDFPDLPLMGVYGRNFVYQHVTGWESFEPTLNWAEQTECYDLWQLAQGMPEEWWNQGDPAALPRLIETLDKRRQSIRNLITAFRNSSRNPFPNWLGK